MIKNKAKIFTFKNTLYVLMLFLLIERLIVMLNLGVDYNLANDDMGYVNSGITFANTGTVSIYSEYPSAMVMPGMAVLAGLVCKITGTGIMYWTGLKLLWICMGVLTAFAVYKSAALFVPRKYALLTMLPFFSPHIAWYNNIILTETPYILFFALTVYFTLAMGENNDRKYFVGFILSFFAALMFRAVAMIYILFAAVYILFKRKNLKLLFKRAAVSVFVILLFVIPWGLRNYNNFGKFIPLTYGTGNPTLQGTYQWRGYPTDDELDYETNVEKPFREKYGQYLDENGDVTVPEMAQYLTLDKDGIKAKYRLSEWFSSRPVTMTLQYLLVKPLRMSLWVFYWQSVMGYPVVLAKLLRIIGTGIYIISLLVLYKKKKFSGAVAFMTVLYWGSLLITGLSYAADRYAEPLMCIRYITICLCLYTVIKQASENREKNFSKKLQAD